MNALIVLIAVSMTGLMAGRLEAGCLYMPKFSVDKFIPSWGDAGCIKPLKPFSKPAVMIYQIASHWFAEEQGDGYCLYRKIQSLRPSMIERRPLLPDFRLRTSLASSSQELSHRRTRPVPGTKVSYQLTSMETVEKIERKGEQVTGKSVSIDDVATALEEEFADSSEASFASGVADYVLSGNAAITGTGSRICFPGKKLGRCGVFQQDLSSVLLSKVVDTIIKTADASSKDSTSCAKQSQI